MAQAAPHRAETHSRREQPSLRETARATSQRNSASPRPALQRGLRAGLSVNASAPARDAKSQLGRDLARALPRGAVRGLSRAAARPPVARTARLKGPAASPAHAPELVVARVPTRLAEMQTPQEIALSFARTPLAGISPAVPGLPQPLAPSDAARLRRIFELQARGEMAQAMRESERLDDRRLMGHVLADRWRADGAAGGGVEPTVAELRAWLSDNSDHPDAPRLHALLVSRLPRGADVPPLAGAPAAEEVPAPGQEVPPEEREPPAAARPLVRNPALDRTVRDMAARGEVQDALRYIASTRGMTPAYAAALQTDVAQVLFTSGKDQEAFRAASLAARTAGAPAQAGFIAGLSAWGLGQYETALPLFEAAARNEAAPAVLRAAAAFWTARAAVRARRPQGYVPWMLQAAQEPRTFYGLVARRALGLPFGFAWEGGEVAGEAEGAALAETAGGWRALALIQIGQKARAEAELRRLWSVARGNSNLARAMLAAATGAGMTELATMLASQAQAADGRPRDYARFPVPRLEPQGGWRADPALIYGLARQESNFDPDAVSPAGARGLMQVMPATAAFITGDASLKDGGRRLHDPGFSLELGQRYLLHLSSQENVKGDLIRMLAAYNAGPGNLTKWMPTNGHREDPFLFIESIPFNETRAYVQRVLAYSWIYASRLGLPSPSLDALAAGSAPRFLGVEELARIVARNRGVR
ncbi:lytic transglycosylase domain-containing protein [Roseomonas populi]|uniref:Lytic transglycosylase domain-containing protein n=1 Tax=Roseomonas populi TaxID=3121582 RepID=A0ABT1X550_9PROT|nr:lytic transglycosylase domain-containing protein [Roseomonas pecuniae]MCR0983230.1 lytic transglycosylase domain-containing protein [Roseomonas pecuniae]